MNILSRRQALALPTLALLQRLAHGANLSNIKLGVTTDEIDDDVATALKFLRDYNLKYAEVRSIWGKYNTSQPLEKIREAKALCDEYGIRLSILSTAFFKISLPPDTPEGRAILEKQWSLLNDAMERGKIMGANTLRVFAFTYPDGTAPDPTHYPRIYELVREAAKRAKAGGFRLALENVGGSYVSTGAESAKLLSAVKNDALGLTWDPNNAGQSGEKSFPEGYKLLDPARIFHVHLRDYRHRPDGKVEWCAVGEGEFDNLAQIRALRKDGFNGTYTLETHYRSPKGKAYATETSLKALLKVFEKV